MGFSSTCIYYTRKERIAGKTKYNIKKMINFAIEGITSFSIKPIRIITIIGFIVFMISIFMMLYTFISYISGKIVAGWTSMMISIWLIGGLQLLALGIIGEYVAKSYLETKHRPRYIIESIINNSCKHK